MEHFKEYLPYQSSMVRMDDNPLTYIMSTPNLDTTGHWWVGVLAWFNFELEYQKGHDNTVADVLSQVTTQLDPDTVKSILNGVTLWMVHQAVVHDPAMVEGDQCLEQELCVTTGHALVEMHVTDQAEAQREDLILSAVSDMLKAQKQTDLKVLLAEHTSSKEGKLILQNQQNFMIHWGPCTYAQCPKVRLKISCSLWSPRPIMLPLWVGATEMQVIKGVTYLVFVVGVLLVARYDQPDTAVYQVLHMLLAAWEPFVQRSFTPNCCHCSDGPLACGLCQHRDNHGAE